MVGDMDRTRPTSLGVRALWAAIIGYALLALTATIADQIVGDVLSSTTVHLLGVAGALTGTLLVVRDDAERSKKRSARTTHRPHDGWIS